MRKVLNGKEALTVRPGADLPPADLEAIRKEAATKTGREIGDYELASYLMYPKVYTDYAKARSQFGDTALLRTPVFFYGLEIGAETTIELEKGKTLLVRLLAVSEPDDEGFRKVFLELNGQGRSVKVQQKGLEAMSRAHPKAEDGNPHHVAAPMPGMVISVAVRPGLKVERGDALVSIEAMKMESVIRAERPGVVKEVHVAVGTVVDAKDLMVVMG